MIAKIALVLSMSCIAWAIEHYAPAPAPIAYHAAAPTFSYAAPAKFLAAAPAPVHYAVAAPKVIAAPATVVKTIEPEPFDPNPQYSFSYGVTDHHTGDSKSAEETLVDGVIHGSYSLTEADGTLRKVTYTADKVHGFNAVVEKSGTPKVEAQPVAVHAVPAIAKVAYAAPAITKVAYAAPAVAKVAYAAPAYAAPAYYHH